MWCGFCSVLGLLEQSMKITKVDCISAITPFLFLSMVQKFMKFVKLNITKHFLRRKNKNNNFGDTGCVFSLVPP